MKRNLLIISLIILMAGCQSGEENGDDVVTLVLVDGEPITLPMLERVMADRGVDEDDHEAMREILDELIRVRAAANAAIEAGLHREPEVRAEIALREMDSLYRRYMRQAESEHEITEADIERVYREQRERAGDTRYRIETIVYEDSARALRDLARAEDGAVDWNELVASAETENRRIDSPGWIDRSQVPADFATALEETDVGELVPALLETQQGERIVRLADTRALEAPPLEEVRAGIRRTLEGQRRQAITETLYEEAEIEPMLPLEEAQ